jgi:putative membrane protein
MVQEKPRQNEPQSISLTLANSNNLTKRMMRYKIKSVHDTVMYFNNNQTSQLNDLIEKIEQRTGIELVAAVVGKCDNYPEIPWKAFALAVAVSTLGWQVLSIIKPDWNLAWIELYVPVFILGVGAACSLLSIYWPAFGRLFLDRIRAEAEIGQYARAFFLERELFRTRARTGVLLLVSLFERRVVILPDSGVSGRLEQKALRVVINQMIPHLRRMNRFQALVGGLSALEAELQKAGFGPVKKTDNELKDELIEQKGVDR